MEPPSCPCGSGLDRAACCGPLLEGEAAKTAEALMRSRYTAFTEANVDYLRRTLAPESQGEFDGRAIELLAPRTRWLGLRIVDRAAGSAGDDEGRVTFEARYLLDGEPEGFRERSRFRRVEGRWRYVDGDLSRLEPPKKPGRNAPCPCGSGKKYKRCCGL